MIFARARVRGVRWPLVAGLAVLAGLRGGWAAGGKAVVARIGEIEIDRATFEAKLAAAAPDTTKTAAEGRRDVLEALIHRQLLTFAARDAGMFAADSVRDRQVRDFEDGLLFQKMRELEINAKVHVTEADVEEWYAKQALAFDASQIVLASEEEAKQVIASLAGGADFAVLADSLSLDARTASRGGRLPVFVWGATSRAFLEALEAMKPGEVGGPVRSEIGYHVLRLNGRVPRPERRPLDEIRESFPQQIRMRMMMEVAGAYYAELDRRYRFTPNWEVARELARQFQAALDGAASSKPDATLEEQANLAMRGIALPESLLSLPLATWDFGRTTVAEEWEEIAGMLGLMLVDRKNPYRAVESAASRFRTQAMIREARDRGLDQDPEIRRRVALRNEELVVDEFYRSHVMERATFSEAEEREYYAAHPEQFDLPARAKVATIQYREASAAKEMEAAIRGSQVHPDSLVATHRAQGVILAENRPGEWITASGRPLLFERAAPLKPGDVTRAIDEDGHWTVLALLEREEAKKLSFEEARETVRASLRNLRVEEILNGVLAELKAKYPVWIDENYLSQAGSGG